MIKKLPSEMVPEAASFDDQYDDNSPKFDTYRHMMSTAGTNKRYLDTGRYNFRESLDPNTAVTFATSEGMHNEVTESLKIKIPDDSKESKKRKKKKTKKSKKKRKEKREEHRSNPLPMKRRATVIVSKRIVRQATERNQTLSEYIRENKLRLVEPSADDLKRVSSKPASTKQIGSLRRGSALESEKYRRWYKKQENHKYEDLDSRRKMDGRILAEPISAGKGLRRKSTMQAGIRGDKTPLTADQKVLRRAGTIDMAIKKLRKLKELEPEEDVEQQNNLVQSRKMSFNDWMVLVFLIKLTVLGVMLSCIEFSYYADSF
jgi:hypothetical protein